MQLQRNRREELERVRRALLNAGLGLAAAQGPGSENRGEIRLELESRGTCTVAGRFVAVPIDVLDMSVLGLRMRISQELFAGDVISVIVCLPGAAPRREEMVVRWVKPGREEDSSWEVGAAIAEPGEAGGLSRAA